MSDQPAVPDAHREVEIFVNDQRVRIAGPHTTGLQIKETAIAQGVKNIALDFVLSVELGDHKARIIRDDETVTVHPGEHFVANPSDDNS